MTTFGSSRVRRSGRATGMCGRTVAPALGDLRLYITLTQVVGIAAGHKGVCPSSCSITIFSPYQGKRMRIPMFIPYSGMQSTSLIPTEVDPPTELRRRHRCRCRRLAPCSPSPGRRGNPISGHGPSRPGPQPRHVVVRWHTKRPSERHRGHRLTCLPDSSQGARQFAS